MHRFSFILIFIIIRCLNAQISEDYSLSSARRAFSHIKIGESRNIYEHIANDINFPVKDRVVALQTLSYQNWKIYEDYEKAKKK